MLGDNPYDVFPLVLVFGYVVTFTMLACVLWLFIFADLMSKKFKEWRKKCSST